MTKLEVAAMAGALAGRVIGGVAFGQVQLGAETTPPITRYYFAQVTGREFFIGRVPKPGEAVEMVYISREPDGRMNFQLRVRQ